MKDKYLKNCVLFILVDRFRIGIDRIFMFFINYELF